VNGAGHPNTNAMLHPYVIRVFARPPRLWCIEHSGVPDTKVPRRGSFAVERENLAQEHGSLRPGGRRLRIPSPSRLMRTRSRKTPPVPKPIPIGERGDCAGESLRTGIVP
jgi:hypothetical protein